MQALLIILLILVAGGGLSGCGPTLYNVSVNGYTEPAAPAALTPGSSVFVMGNQKAQNPLLEKEIADKINKLLTNRGYTLAPYEQAQYYLMFSYGIGPRRETTPADYYTSYGFSLGGGGGRGWYGGGPFFYGGPFFGFYPGPENRYDRWLLINVVDGKNYREKHEFHSVWVGEARSTGSSGDLRTVINYLLLADFQHFGQNTGKAVQVEVNQDAPQVQGLIK